MLAKKIFLLSLAILFCSLNFSVASAEIKIIEGKGEYTIDKNLNETIEQATEHAREEATRSATNQAAFYVESKIETKNNQLVESKIKVYSASIMKQIDEDVRFETIDGGKNTKIVCILKVEVDDSKINPEEILGRDIQLKKQEEQNKKIQQLEEENKKLKAQFEKANSDKQKSEIKNQFDKNQQLFLITKFERDLDLLDLDSSVDWKKILPTAEKLQELDPLNVSAFRATIYAYREQGDLKKSVDYCNRFLNSNCPDDTAIESCAQLGDIYLNEFDDKATAKIFVDKGIKLVKKNYSATMIEKFVNGTNFQVSEFIPTGKTNTIRELYILKCDIENILPTFKEKSVVEDMLLTEDKIYDIKYKTNW